ncbi:outer membrane receptor protein involved in Fe transport [Cellulophaga sp. RHA19]|uniref:TonB-dependent receptor n=1 Tax=Cellulophaga sp. RHA19 TaxID=1798237 RepID=UPI000C2BBE48|nr:TonB-dependent receptor [Cellulophaga sp. RHA19]PKB44918.1 outer membrane receptor protein involved in Fe transport [Cellulophaga sp. RHA19]
MPKRGFFTTISYIFILFLSFTTAFSQSKSGITGKVTEENNQPIEAATVTLLNPTDSTYVDYTITNSTGYFNLDKAKEGNYILQISFMGFESFSKNINFKTSLLDLNTIVLKEDSFALDGITLTAVVPIQIKQDTIAYNANSFKTNPDDNLEELLTKLPGLEIDADGNINAQGNEVAKIMVDGKEFFGGDPSIVLKNLSADAIANIEIIDKKSDESELTGVDDGNKQMVINFTLKKTKKNNGFGKVSAGMGLDSKYFSNLNYNKFTSKTQFSVIGKLNNINITGSNIQGFLKNANGIADDSDDDDQTNQKNKSLSGYLKTGVAGINIGHEFKDKESLNIDFFYNLSDNEGVSKTKRINFSNNSNFDFRTENTFNNSSNNYNLNFDYKNKSNKNNSLLIKGKFTKDNVDYITNRDGFYFNELNELATSNIAASNNKRDKSIGDVTINFYQRLAKLGRSFNVGLKTTANNSNRLNNQTTLITRRQNTDNPTSSTINAIRDEEFLTTMVNLNFKYTEPLGNNHYAKLETYLRNRTNNEDVHQAKTTIGTTTKDELLAYKYKHIENSAQTRLVHSYSPGKLNTYAAIELQELGRTFGVLTETNIVSNKLYVNPMANIVYKPVRGQKYRLNYKKFVRNPNSFQSSTVINDINPYNIRKGNPDLNAEKTNAFTINTVVHNFKSDLSFNTRFDYQNTTDAIIRSVTIDDDYVKTISYQNSGKKERFSNSLSFGQKLKDIGLRYTFKNKNTYTSVNSIVNLQTNKVKSTDIMLSLLLENSNKSTLDVKAGATYSTNNTTFSIENNLDRKYTKQQYFVMFDKDFTKKLSFNTQLDYLVFVDDKFESNQKLPLWNATVSYALNKNRSNLLKLVLIDLLDKNINIARRSTINYFEETESESLGRYVILSFTHKLKGTKKKTK